MQHVEQESAADPGRNFQARVKAIIRRIPYGRVATYGQIALLAGKPHAARQVGRILRSSSEQDRLPWHRVINSTGRISLPDRTGYLVQKQLLLQEGVRFNAADRIDLERYGWRADSGTM